MFKEIGTLAEIGAKVGDVVENDSTLGIDETLIVREWHLGVGGLKDNEYRIVYRAEQSPVRTVTRKEIVPGVYGNLKVAVVAGDIYVSMTQNGKADHAYRMSRADLIAARDVFNQLIDAMEE